MSLAFVFPGQGSQSLGMLSEMALAHPQIEQTFAEASAVLGYDLWGLSQQGPEEKLNRTEQTQPVMLAAGVAVWRTWRTCGGVSPAYLAGHSLGEYSALVCANSLDFTDAVKLVAARGRFMQEAVPVGEGAIAAVLGLDDAQVLEACEEAMKARSGEVASAVNFNAPGQVVVAGNAAAVALALELAKEKGARRAVTLPMSVPVHCELMRPATERLSSMLARASVRAPEIPVVNNADVAMETDPDAIRDALARQLFSPVRWSETILKLSREGAQVIVECGPGRVLSGLMKRIDPNVKTLSLHDPDSLRAALVELGG
ncbi:MAG TPA: ACP S-malonyltransferase [Gammaproteobacteria bacterium]|nr:ACP S-malonyltransferase [Gammaproteobacteria bacterium]